MSKYSKEYNINGIEFVTYVTLNYTIEKHIGGKRFHLVHTRCLNYDVNFNIKNVVETIHLGECIGKHEKAIHDYIHRLNEIQSEEQELLNSLGFTKEVN